MNRQVTEWKLFLKHIHSGAGVRAQLARGTLRGLGVSMLGIGVGFLLQVAIARLLGVHEFGVYAWALAWASSLLTICCSGLDGLMVRKLPSYLIDNQCGKARGFLLFSGYWVGGCGLLCGLAMYAIASVLQEHILPGSLDTLALCVLVIPLFALANMRQAALRALKHVAKAQLLDAVVRPIFLVLLAVGLVYLFGIAATSTTVMLAQLIASVIVFVIGGFWVLKALPPEVRQAPPDWDGKSWLKESIPFFAMRGASMVSGQVGLLTLGVFATAADAGLFAAISRIADFSLMGSYAVGAIASPLIVEVLKKNDKAGLVQIMKWGARGAFVFCFTAVLGIVLFGGWILAAFGKGFAGGHGVLYVMLPGPLFGAFAGVSGYLLSMSGHAKIMAAIGWFAAVCSFLICIAFVPKFGVYAAAFGYTLPSLFEGIFSLFFCWRRHKIWSGLR